MADPQSKRENMKGEHCKRKAVLSPANGETETGARENKIRKPNPPANPNASQVQTQSNERNRDSDMVKKLVAAWIGDSEGRQPFMTHESVRESQALRDSQQQCSEAEALIQTLQQKVQDKETVICNLKNDIKTEGKVKMDIIDKLNTTGQLTAAISDHINYITDTLGRCQQHKDHLSKLYDNVILKQMEDRARLESREKQLQEQSTNFQKKIAALETNLESRRHMDNDELNQRQRAHEIELATVRNDHEKTKKQLATLEDEKKKIVNNLVIEKQSTLDLEKKIHDYESEMKKLTDELSRISGNLRLLEDNKKKCEDELSEKDCNILKIGEELESATRKIAELSAEVASLNDANSELEYKLERELTKREELSASFNVKNEALARQVERLRESKDEAVREMRKRKDDMIEEMKKSVEESVKEAQQTKENAVHEMQKKIEEAEKEIQRVLTESKSSNDELKQKYEEQLNSQVEKYEDCMSQIKMLEARHKSELSRASVSSSTSIATANTEKRKLQRELDTLKQEKERLQTQCKQTEDLLKSHTDSEKLLQKKLNQAEIEAEKLASDAATAVAEKKRLDYERNKSISKIKELEQELLNLRVNKTNPSTATKVDPVIGNDNRLNEKETPKNSPIVVHNFSKSAKKSILKRPTAEARKARSSPPSPAIMTQLPPSAMKKSITFDLEDSSDSSPIRSVNTTTAIKKILDNDTLFDNLIAVGKSSSQPMEASVENIQKSISQVSGGGRKFFKSRFSQAK